MLALRIIKSTVEDRFFPLSSFCAYMKYLSFCFWQIKKLTKTHIIKNARWSFTLIPTWVLARHEDDFAPAAEVESLMFTLGQDYAEIHGFRAHGTEGKATGPSGAYQFQPQA